MSKHLQRELENLNNDLLQVGVLVEQHIEKAIAALHEKKDEIAQQVIEGDALVDRKEVEIEESCLKILALHQPVAEDLRFIAAVIRINNDLERIGDYAVSIAERARHMMKAPIPIPLGIQQLEKLARQMVHESLAAFVKRDSQEARNICVMDNEMDKVHRETIQYISDFMKKNPNTIDSALDLFTTARRLERIGDMATNICQDIVYMVEGEIIRHYGSQNP